jgi:ubiquitin C-terminal hydrolase
LKASFDEKSQEFIIDETVLSEHEQFILSCIRYQKLLQIIITLYNTYEKKDEDRSRYLLKKTFTILNTHRTEVKFDNFVDPKKIINDLEYSRNSLIGYTECIYKIRSILENFSQSQLTN